MQWNRRSSGVAKGGLATGIVGTSLGAINSLALMGTGVGLLSGLGRNTQQPVVVMDTNNGYPNGGCCSEDHFVNRYELELQQKIAEKDSQIALRDANTYGDQKMLEMYKYIDGQLKNVRDELCRQAVVNQKTEDSFALVAKDVQCCCDRLGVEIQNERNERKCADNSIITYTNATFYPKMVADVTTGTTTTAQRTYNPLPSCGSCCNNNGNNQ